MNRSLMGGRLGLNPDECLDIAIPIFCQYQILWFVGDYRGKAVDKQINAQRAESGQFRGKLSTEIVGRK
ncbi:MAG: hypothetical protein M3Z35_10055, partial [Nitrospirota bacterium]|nr:hypothetical protein [Nitrospirota bacterium]